MFSTVHVALRIICSILIQMALNKELVKSMKMLTYLKQVRRKDDNSRGRYINIVLCSMQILASFGT